MSPAGSDEFDNSKYQQKLAKIILKKMNSQPDVARTITEIHEEFFAPLPHNPSQELIEYTIERMLQHDDSIIEHFESDNDSGCICIERRRVREYIRIHLDTRGDPFPDVDPTPFRNKGSS